MDSKVTKYQKFDTETISRNQVKNAEYNPRLIDADAKKRLKEGIRKHGMVSPITWNRRTGNIVGGHQRIQQLDALEKSSDYDITVCVIDVDEREEAILNVQLNNPSMQGDWRLDKLADMADEFDLSFDDMGFSDLDVDLLFDGDDRFSELFQTPEAETTKEAIQAVREARDGGREYLKEENSIAWYAVIVFKDEAERKDFMRRISIPPHEDYITVDQIERLLG